MRVIYEKAISEDEEQAIIKSVQRTDEIEAAINLLENAGRRLAVIRAGQTYLLESNKIYYVESVDKKTFIYTKEDCYESKLKLYELEEILNADFFRCAKAMIVNIRKIRAVKSDLNGRMNAKLLNGETIVIARSYVKDLKKRLGI